MSRQQWGHGYKKGYQDATHDADDKAVFDSEPHAHWVPIKFFGKEGIQPISQELCPFHKEDYSCQSDGSGSICCGLRSFHKSMKYILCVFESPSHKRDFNPD